MRHTEQRWMHLESGRIRKSGFDPCKESVDNYLLVTVTWDEPEMETVEVTKWGVLDPPFNGEEPRLGATFYNERDDAFERLVRQYRGRQAVKIVYTYTRRKPEPEPQVCEREVRANRLSTEAVTPGLIYDLPGEWIGKRVRVEVLP